MQARGKDSMAMNKDKTEWPVPTALYDGRHCEACGSVVVLSIKRGDGFRGSTGEPLYDIYGRCPNRTVIRRSHFDGMMVCGVTKSDAEGFVKAVS